MIKATVRFDVRESTVKALKPVVAVLRDCYWGTLVRQGSRSGTPSKTRLTGGEDQEILE